MKKLLVVFGGPSSEHSISCVSAGNILENINNKYEVTTIGVYKDSIWYKYKGNIKNIKDNIWFEDKDNLEIIEDEIKEIKKYNVVFPVIHGKYGEDGQIQKLVEMAGVKCVGCKSMPSSIGMNKIFCKKLISVETIPIVDYVSIEKQKFEELLNDSDELNNWLNLVVQKLGLPLIVKPNQEGSSYGINKVNMKSELVNAVKFGLDFDDEILIEKYILNKKEVECAVLERNDRIIISNPGEIIMDSDVYDFDSKYKNNTTSLQIPANISIEIKDKIKKYSRSIFRILNLSGLARIDFFVSNDKIYFNEVNTMPGFTSTSMYPKLLISDGISYNEIIDILIEEGD